LVRWKDTAPEEDSWVHETVLVKNGFEQLLQEYKPVAPAKNQLATPPNESKPRPATTRKRRSTQMIDGPPPKRTKRTPSKGQQSAKQTRKGTPPKRSSPASSLNAFKQNVPERILQASYKRVFKIKWKDIPENNDPLWWPRDSLERSFGASFVNKIIAQYEVGEGTSDPNNIHKLRTLHFSNGKSYIAAEMLDGSTSVFPSEILKKACPLRLIEFYETKMRN